MTEGHSIKYLDVRRLERYHAVDELIERNNPVVRCAGYSLFIGLILKDTDAVSRAL